MDCYDLWIAQSIVSNFAAYCERVKLTQYNCMAALASCQFLAGNIGQFCDMINSEILTQFQQTCKVVTAQQKDEQTGTYESVMTIVEHQSNGVSTARLEIRPRCLYNKYPNP